MQRRRSLGIRLLAVFATASLVAYAAYAYAGIRDVRDPHCERSPKLAAGESAELMSWEEARDIVECDRLDGLTKRELRDRLGDPIDHHDGDPSCGGDGTTWYYDAGDPILTPNNLVIEFDSAGVVVDSSTISVPGYASD